MRSLGLAASLKPGAQQHDIVLPGVQAQKEDAATAALQAERVERASLAERLGVAVRERDAGRRDAEALRAELAAQGSRHESALQVRPCLMKIACCSSMLVVSAAIDHAYIRPYAARIGLEQTRAITLMRSYCMRPCVQSHWCNMRKAACA